MCRAVRTYILSSAELVLCGLYKTLHQTQYKIYGTGKTFRDIRPNPDKSLPLLFIVFSNGAWSNIRNDIQLIRESIPCSRVVVLTPPEKITDPLPLLQLGVSAYLADTISVDALVKSLDVVMADGIVFPSHAMREAADFAEAATRAADEDYDRPAAEQTSLPVTSSTPPMLHRDHDMPTLSDRETVILQSLINGDSNKHIARELDIAEATVKVHVKAILRKIRVRNRTQAAIWAIRNSAAPPLQARLH